MDEESFLKKYTPGFSSQQIQAVTTVDGPVLLLAVPGSGKTTVLIARIGYMIYVKNIDPRSILVMTYTTATADEMKKRFAKRFGQELADNIVRLLNDDQMNAKLSDNAVGFTRRFKSEKIIPVWNQMFHEIQEGVPAKYIKPENNEYRPKSYDLKMALHNARMKFGMRFVPS